MTPALPVTRTFSGRPAATTRGASFGAPTTVVVPADTVVDVDPTMAPTRGTVVGTITETGPNTAIAGSWALALSNGGVPQTGVVANGPGQFTPGSGLDGDSSDWLLATTLTRPDGLSVTNRALFDNRFSFAKDELRLAWAAPRYDVAASYVWMLADPAEFHPTDF